MKTTNQVAEHANAFEQSLETFGWGAILIASGTMWLLPAGSLPQGTWLMTMGLILLGLNAARYSVRRQWNSCSLALGILALAAGLGALLHVNLPLLAITLIVFGVLALLVPRYERKERGGGYPDHHCCEQ
jgi:hypothetical protein